MTFLQKAAQLEASQEEALQVLAQFNGDEERALGSITAAWLKGAQDELHEREFSNDAEMALQTSMTFFAHVNYFFVHSRRFYCAS